MSPEERQQLDQAIVSCTEELKDLLEYSKTVAGSLRINRYIKQKTVYRMNIYSAIYQRTHGVTVLIEAKQANAASILLRSIWELHAAHNFVGMDKGNKYLEILQALDSRGIKKQWSAIKRLRTKYPNSNTWQDRWDDTVIEDRIQWGEDRLAIFRSKQPSVNLETYANLLARIEAVDDYNVANYPNHKALMQMDYRTVYSLLSEDVHSTVYGTVDNSRLHSGGLQIRLDNHSLDSLRYITTAYNMLLDYTNFMTRHYRLNQSTQIRNFRRIEKAHEELYKSLEN